jgi:hypothetical protein
MRVHEALLYLEQRNLDPLMTIECQAPDCTCSIRLAEAVAFPARVGGSERLQMAFFCSEECYLNAVPACACPKG